ncbi:hypothetical protein GCM10009759_10200 [Kitasatospora saccharophila]|uniref:Uncharacterized protein n=1 Tax=Kitasatospora saccharophila TaxID=407973 RepID=A0ABN2WBD9_9ACTN
MGPGGGRGQGGEGEGRGERGPGTGQGVVDCHAVPPECGTAVGAGAPCGLAARQGFGAGARTLSRPSVRGVHRRGRPVRPDG